MKGSTGVWEPQAQLLPVAEHHYELSCDANPFRVIITGKRVVDRQLKFDQHRQRKTWMK